MVALAFFSALFATASVGVPSVLIVPMSKDLGWSIGEIAAPTGLRLALFGLSAPFAGGLMLKYGPRRMVGLSGFVLIIGLIISILTTEKWHLWLGMGILLGIGPGLTAKAIPELQMLLGANFASGSETYLRSEDWFRSELFSWLLKASSNVLLV